MRHLILLALAFAVLVLHAYVRDRDAARADKEVDDARLREWRK